LNVVINLNMVIKNSADVEAKMSATERILEYSVLPAEAPPYIPETKPAAEWPSAGLIELDQLELRYRPELEPALHAVSCVIQAGEKIGVCGRTGAGKSTLMVSLFRIVEPSRGRILIDGVDISTIGLIDLRARLTIIPQDPMLFTGSIRTNVDILGGHGDPAIWSALERAGLGSTVRDMVQDSEAGASMKLGLDSVVAEGGLSLSAGQRQLLCLARALLRDSKVLMLDEATASVDATTDEYVQRAIRAEFKSATCLVIAHRLDTIIDSDRVMVLDKGSVVELDSPQQLLSQADGVFTALVRETGPASEARLRSVAAGEIELFAKNEHDTEETGQPQPE